MKLTKIILLICVSTCFCLSCNKKYDFPDIEQELEEYSGVGYVIGSSSVGSKVLFAATISQQGEYIIEIRYSNPTNETATASVYINDTKVGKSLLMENVKENIWQSIERKVPLNNGVNFIAIQCDIGDTGVMRLDYIIIRK